MISTYYRVTALYERWKKLDEPAKALREPALGEGSGDSTFAKYIARA